MKYVLFLVAAVCSGFNAYAYEGPAPLKNIKIKFSAQLSRHSIFTYSYDISNPSSNNGIIYAVDIFLDGKRTDVLALSSKGLTQCREFHELASEHANQVYSMPPVGSNSPKGWSCSYGTLDGYTKGSFGWGASESTVIKPGHSLGGFVLTSYGLPGIRDILIQPDVDTSRLPPEYSKNVEKTVALENKVKWMGKTIGPKAPPKTLNPGEFLRYLESLNHQAADLGWVKGKGIERRLDAKLRLVEKGIDKQSGAFSKPFLRSFVEEVQALRRHHLSEEGYALLYYNAQYLLDHLDVGQTVLPSQTKPTPTKAPPDH